MTWAMPETSKPLEAMSVATRIWASCLLNCRRASSRIRCSMPPCSATAGKLFTFRVSFTSSHLRGKKAKTETDAKSGSARNEKRETRERGRGGKERERERERGREGERERREGDECADVRHDRRAVFAPPSARLSPQWAAQRCARGAHSRRSAAEGRAGVD